MLCYVKHIYYDMKLMMNKKHFQNSFINRIEWLLHVYIQQCNPNYVTGWK